jgi:hypothetical protein
MICTKCSDPIRPIVAIDIDGTLGDYHNHFAKFARDWLNKDPAKAGLSMFDYDGSESHGDWFCRTFDVDRTTFRAIKLAYRQGGQKRIMPIYRGAADLLDMANRRDCEVWITTTRPWERFDRIDPDSRHWLDKHDLVYDVLMFDEAKMLELHRRVDPGRVVMILDDQVDVLYQARNLFSPSVPVIAGGMHNSGVRWGGRGVDSLIGAQVMLEKRVQQWRNDHAV